MEYYIPLEYSNIPLEYSNIPLEYSMEYHIPLEFSWKFDGLAAEYYSRIKLTPAGIPGLG